MITTLAEAFRRRNAMVFVGAGMSTNVGAPSWNTLVDHVAEMLGYDPDIFRTMGDSYILAEYYLSQRATLGELRSWMDVRWHSDEQREKVRTSEVYKLLLSLPADLLYTTNYDKYLEWAAEDVGKPFKKIVSVANLVELKSEQLQIVKFHGDFTDDNSIVLAESAYFERLNFESPLDLKLRADVLGKTILFIGYSLTDINMRLMLYKLHKLWQSTPYANGKPSSYIFLGRPNPVQEAVLKGRGVETIVSRLDDPAEGLLDFLKELNVAIS